MSNTERFWCHEAKNIRCVRESDYDRDINALRAQVEAIRKVAIEMRGWLECHDVNHHSGEFHEAEEPCKVLARIDLVLQANHDQDQ